MLRDREPTAEFPFHLAMAKSPVSVDKHNVEWLWVLWYARKHVKDDPVSDTYYAQKLQKNNQDTNQYGWQKITLDTAAAVIPTCKASGKGKYYIKIDKRQHKFARDIMATMQQAYEGEQYQISSADEHDGYDENKHNSR